MSGQKHHVLLKTPIHHHIRRGSGAFSSLLETRSQSLGVTAIKWQLLSAQEGPPKSFVIYSSDPHDLFHSSSKFCNALSEIVVPESHSFS